MKKLRLKVNGMTCAHCSKSVEDVFSDVGIKANVNLSAGSVVFSYDEEKISLEYLKRLVRQAGFDLVLPNQKNKINFIAIRFYFALLVLIISLIGMGHHLGLHNEFFLFMDNNILKLVIASCSLIILGLSFNIRALKNLRQKRLGMDFLVSLSTLVAYGVSLYAFVVGHDITYFESTTMILAIITIGDKITAKIKSSTGMNTFEALKNDGTMVSKLTKKGTIIDIDIDQVNKGDVLLCKKGEMIGADGVLLSDQAMIDEKILTGESRPRNAHKNEKVYYGTSNLGEEFLIQVEKPAIDSMYMGIILESYALDRSKGHLNKISDTIASIFVPAVLFISLIGFFINFYGMKNDVETSVLNSISILVVSCPCAFGLAVPLSSLNGYNRALKEGIMFKDGSTFEKIKRVNEFYFDKTGTLTTGLMKVVYAEFSDSKYKAIVKAMERHSIHPIAISLVNYLNEEEDEILENVNEISGGGLIYKDYKIGNYEFVGTPILDGKFKEINKYNGTKVFLSKNGTIVAALVLHDEIAIGAHELIDYLHQNDIKTYMLTGDGKEFAIKIGEELGFNEENVFFELKPADKFQTIKEHHNEKAVSAYCGDGVNDLAALSYVDLSIASYRASSATSSNSDVILLHDDLSLIKKTIKLSRHVYYNILQNFMWAIVYNAVMIPLAMIGKLQPTLSAVLMIVSNITLVLNSWRISFWKGGKNEKGNKG